MSIPERQYGCPVEVTMEALGGKWKATILWWLRRSAKRPSELRQLIPKISQKVLTTQLQELEADGLIDRQTYRETPPRVEYSLTPRGESLRSLVEQMAEWGKQKMPEFQFGIIRLVGITLLIVGDEATTQALQAQFTVFYGASVATAPTIPGLERMRQIQPDVVLVDLDGDEASAPRQGQDPRALQSDLVPPVSVIALVDPQRRGQAFAQGFRMVLIKPVEAVELVAAIASVTERLG